MNVKKSMRGSGIVELLGRGLVVGSALIPPG
jgi:hypothetical protein